MNVTVLYAVLGVLVIALPAVFISAKKSGARGELDRQAAAKATAEETAKRIVGEAEREAENMRKSAVVSGKEELIKHRENFEVEVRGRREEIGRASCRERV